MKLKYIIYTILFSATASLGILFLIDRVAPHSYKIHPVAGSENAVLTSGQIRYQRTGSGQNAILFLHGFNAHLGSWNKVWSKLNNCARAVRMDIPGFGNSDNWDTDTYALPDQGKRIIEFMDTLGLAHVSLVGITMGANLSVWLASHYPSRIGALVLISPSAYTNALQHTGLYGLLTKPGVLNDMGIFIARTDFYKKLFPNSRALHSFTVTSSYGYNWDAELENIKIPTVVLSSKNNALIPVEYAHIISSKIKNSIFIPLLIQNNANIENVFSEVIATIACQITNGTDTQQISNNIYNLL